ncbi:MAG: galactokinase family protein, partial [Promethearchaeota archaeon]
MPLVDDWITFFTDASQSANLLREDYGVDYHDFEGKQKTILQLLNLHRKKFGNEDIIIVRVPGRINLMGRHVDHQNGLVNLIAIDKEIFITASIRKDFKIVAYNFDAVNFADIKIDLSNLTSEICHDWLDVINNADFITKYKSPQGNWDNYLKAAYVRLINLYELNEVYGANICILGNILIAAGLSSSSALTVGIFAAISILNKLNIKEEEMINPCAEAEWFVGTRGGSADQVAILLAKKNQIAHVKLFPHKILDWIDFPKNCELLIFNSQILADKSGAKKDIFNEKILAYDIGFYLIKKNFPQFSSKLFYLSDINPQNLKIKSSDVMKLLLELPEYILFKDVPNILGNRWDELKKKYHFNTNPQKIPIRKVITYGISECERSKIFNQLIKKGDLISAGVLMNISHNGDRVVKYDYKQKSKPI